MRRCPTCNQTFEEDWLSFCTQDGTTLIEDSVEASEPLPTIVPPHGAEPAVADEQATWNLPSANAVAASPLRQQPAETPVWQPPPPPTYVQPPSKTLATAAMVAGILSMLCLGPIPGIFAIVLGGMSLSQMKKEPERVAGQQMAWAGIVTGGLSILIYSVLVIFYIFVIVAAKR
jgi:hypothetical protein